MTTSLNDVPAPIWWMWAGCGAHLSRASTRGGELPGRYCPAYLGGHGEVLRGSRGDAAGVELGSYFVESKRVNTGTVSVLPGRRAASAVFGLGPPSIDRVETGRSRRSTPSRGKPGTWGRAAAVPRRVGCCHADRCAGECRRSSVDWDLQGLLRRVSGKQAELHRQQTTPSAVGTVESPVR